MPRYRVQLARRTWEYAYPEVDAADEDAAIRIAEQQAAEVGEDRYRWYLAEPASRALAEYAEKIGG